jgi:hypothetical protein
MIIGDSPGWGVGDEEAKHEDENGFGDQKQNTEYAIVLDLGLVSGVVHIIFYLFYHILNW